MSLCRNVEYHFVECRYVECRYVKCRYVESRHVECRYVKCRISLCQMLLCHYVECQMSLCQNVVLCLPNSACSDSFQLSLSCNGDIGEPPSSDSPGVAGIIISNQILALDINLSTTRPRQYFPSLFRYLPIFILSILIQFITILIQSFHFK